MSIRDPVALLIVTVHFRISTPVLLNALESLVLVRAVPYTGMDFDDRDSRHFSKMCWIVNNHL